MVRRNRAASGAARTGEVVPLSPPVYHVLLALGDETKHGYAMMRSFDEMTGGKEQLLPGTLYATISRMVEAGLIEEADPPDPAADSRRRYYRVTPHGLDVAAAESARMRLLLDVARRQGIQPERAR
jgi:DNA-binding PadR family transcriptional regulator